MSTASKHLKIVLTGGGSGGHITPLQAVAAELKRLHANCELVYIGQKDDGLADIPAKDPNFDAVYSIRTGKFRRYHGEGWRQLLDIKTWLLNIRDFFFVLIGLFQSRKLLKQLQPDGIFVKGGFVGVPVGLAAANLHIPFVTHDSDAVPGLANRIISRWASCHAVALPVETYSYPAAKTVQTGIPLQANFKPVTAALRKQYRHEIDVPDSAKLLFIIGGGLGAERINLAMAEAVPHLMHEFPNLYVVHGAGRAHEDKIKAIYGQALSESGQKRVRVFGYIDDVYRYSGAADIVVTRAGATNLAEFALQGKACIVVPSAVLAAGHQVKNAAYLASQHAAVVLDEDDLEADPNRLASQASSLLHDEKQIDELGAALAKFGHKAAAQQLSKLILKYAGQGRD